MATSRQTSNQDLPPPSLALLALEVRAPFEFGAVLPAWPALTRAPAGDGHTVLVFPGLSASDTTTVPLRTYLGSLGYRSRGWSQGFNLLHFGHQVSEARCRQQPRSQLIRIIGTSSGVGDVGNQILRQPRFSFGGFIKLDAMLTAPFL